MNAKLKAVTDDGVATAPATELVTMKSRWVDVTPEKAAEWLQNNVCNRRLRVDVVSNYARQMLRGEWLPIPQGIAFDTKQQLLNGQHRLHAIVASGVTVRLMVTTGVPSRIGGSEVAPMDLMDTGVPRSITDQLKIQHGLSGGSVMAGIARGLANVCLPQRTRKVNVAEVLRVYRLLQMEMDFVMHGKSKEHGLKQVGLLTAFAFAMHAEESHREDYEGLVTDDLPEGSPLQLLRAFLTSDEAILLSRRNDRAICELTLGVLRAVREERTIETLEAADNGVEYYHALNGDLVREVAAIFQPGATAPTTVAGQ